ncbi:MAG: hypothetical protein JNK29_13330 [Anaerolineales bacterium]|nr:hypothetical protein [Anaerolineales bacterium]
MERCSACGALWSASLYEPYAAFEYVARWEASEAEWLEQHAADDGRSLLRWHAAQVRDHWEALPAPERERVDQHRRRSQGHHPIDSPAAFGLGEK